MAELQNASLIVGIGGTAAPISSPGTALTLALKGAGRRGVRTRRFGGQALAALPQYMRPGGRSAAGAECYHDAISGRVKNAIDYLEETARDARPCLDGFPVGLIVTPCGWQATGSTRAALRAIVHALRGWPIFLGVSLNTSGGL